MLRIFLVRSLVIAGVAAGFAVHESVLTHADIELRLTEAAEFVALALSFGSFALRARVFAGAGSGRHISNVTPSQKMGNVPLVTDGLAAESYPRLKPLLIGGILTARLEAAPFQKGIEHFADYSVMTFCG